MEQTILFGNGINRFGSEQFAWDNILSSVSVGNMLPDKIANTHKYEDILLGNKFVPSVGSKNTTLNGREAEIKRQIHANIERITISDDAKALYNRLAALDVSNYLTTNYDEQFDEALKNNKFQIDLRNSRTKENIYSILRRRVYRKENNEVKNVWHLHGNYESPKSLMLGYDHYCGAIQHMEEYIKNGKLHTEDYKLFKKIESELKNRNIPSYIIHRLKNVKDEQRFISWIEAFFVNDVHIIGFGMDFSEIDLWWILNKRTRLKQYIWSKNPEYNNLINNNIYFYGSVSKEIEIMLKSYDVDTTNVVVKKPTDWSAKYNEWIDIMAENIQNRINA